MDQIAIHLMTSQRKHRTNRKNSAAEFRLFVFIASDFDSGRHVEINSRFRFTDDSISPQSKIGIGTIYQRQSNKSMTPKENCDSQMNVAANKNEERAELSPERMSEREGKRLI